MSAGVTLYCDCQGHQVCKSSISTVEQYRDDARNNARTWGWECDERGDYAHGHAPSDTAVVLPYTAEGPESLEDQLRHENAISEGVSA